MSELQFLETPVRHASGYLGFFDATGFSADDHKPRVSSKLAVRLDTAPRDLELRHKPSGLGLLRNLPHEMTDILPGRARGDALARPAQDSYRLRGVIFDRRGYFNPRAFSLDAGEGKAYWLRVFRSPLGTRRPHAGWLVARLGFADGSPASWAVATCTVSPPLGGELVFTAQADVHGDLLLPLNRMPALGKSDAETRYPATLSIKADPAVSRRAFADPETFADCSIAAPGDGAFAASLALKIAPGKEARISSKDSEILQLQKD